MRDNSVTTQIIAERDAQIKQMISDAMADRLALAALTSLVQAAVETNGGPRSRHAMKALADWLAEPGGGKDGDDVRP